MPHAASRARKTLTALTGSALALAGLTFVAPAAHAADPVVINLVGINDFHGRINVDTIKWAKTVQDVKARADAAHTLFVGAGDLVGASEFASATAEDQPTIDVLNELGLDASSVGNHEFDEGWDDLENRIIGAGGSANALWDYLGANVYLKGTQTPALPSYWTKDVEGITVGVIGGVTDETPTLVSPGGITEIDFGPLVPALNRVADQLTDGDDSNGEADVIVAVTHAGAIDGSKTYADNAAVADSEFKDMAENLSPKVSAVFQGHTHQVYAYDAPVTGGDLPNRPMLQTGNYGTNVGNIQLTVDSATKKVTAYTKENVTRVASVTPEQIAADPALTEVNTTVNDAVAAAAVVGNQPVGSVTADITTARPRPAEPVTLPPGTNRDDRTNESTLGDLIGNAMRDGVPADMGDPDIGIVNSGGLRSELLYAGDTSSNPANTDGVVTFAEANNVLPFVNNVWLGSISGADLKNVLEEQWQPDGAARPRMPLGLSDNVTLTYDESKPRYSRVTSVLVDGKPLDPAKTYTVSTFNFLSTGGDNFTSFKNATWSDTGLVDRDLWIAYLKSHPKLSPDFARQQVGESGLPASVTGGDAVEFTLSKLDLTSSMSPANTSVDVYLSKAGAVVAAGSYPVAAGSATVSFTAPSSLQGDWAITAIAQPTKTTVGPPISVEPQVTVTAPTVNPGNKGRVTVKVVSGGVSPAGTATIKSGSTILGTAAVPASGVADVVLGTSALPPGVHTLTASYSGNDVVAPRSVQFTLRVNKAAAKVKVTKKPKKVVRKKTRAVLTVVVTGFQGAHASGRVTAKIGKKTVSGTLVNGVAKLKLPKIKTAGKKSVVVTYLGDGQTLPLSQTVKLTVKKK
jgi:5'-nucleotidase